MTASTPDLSRQVMIQDFERELSGVQFRSIEEQWIRAQKILFDQQQRQCMVRLADSRTPVALYTPTVAQRPTSSKQVERYVRKRMKRWKFVLSAADTQAGLAAKEKDIEEMILKHGKGEPKAGGFKVR